MKDLDDLVTQAYQSMTSSELSEKVGDRLWATRHLRDAVRSLLIGTEQLWVLLKDSQPTTVPITNAAPTEARASVVQEPVLTRQTTQPSSLQPGDQMVADLFHAAQCSTCAEALGVLLAQCRTHALVAAGQHSISVKQPSSESAAILPAGSAPSRFMSRTNT
jgi:hypothetical protein